MHLQKYDGPFLECLVKRSDTYNDVIERGALVLGVHTKPHIELCVYLNPEDKSFQQQRF